MLCLLQKETNYLFGLPAQLVEAMRYKPEGRGFDSCWFHWKFAFRSHYGPVFDSASNRNEYQKYFLGIKAAGAWG